MGGHKSIKPTILCFSRLSFPKINLQVVFFCFKILNFQKKDGRQEAVHPQ